MNITKRLGLFFAGAVAMSAAQAGVNLKNGNFYISYTDIVVPGGGKKLEITRTYNSTAHKTGWFGFGWGSEFEHRLEVSADGSVVINEHGQGGTTRFVPKAAVDGESAAKKIVEAMRKRTQLTDAAAAQLLEKLKNNAELRHVYARNFRVQTNLAGGSVFCSSDRGNQELQVTKEGYKRIMPDGRVEFFGPKGMLTKIADKTGYSIDFVWKDDKLDSIKDSQAKQIFFSWYADGRVKQLWSAGDKKAEYKYQSDNLVYSKDVGDHVYEYTYDKTHNMTEIAYADKTKMLIKYEPKTFFVSEITDRNGEATKYVYGNDPKATEDHYWTSVTKKGFDGKPVTNKYEYEIKTRPDGSRYTYRIITEINGIKTETIYSECCSLPLKIARGKHVTNFEYNDRGLLLKKSSTKGDFVTIEYDDALNKIKKVVNNEGTTEFGYDKQGNLTTAKNDKGKGVLLVYDTKGKITKMVDDDKKTNQRRTLAFKYNALGKPVEIEMENVGKINVAYDNYGEIKKVESAAGHKMALQVTQAFQNLLAIVKPAGVNLNM